MSKPPCSSCRAASSATGYPTNCPPKFLPKSKDHKDCKTCSSCKPPCPAPCPCPCPAPCPTPCVPCATPCCVPTCANPCATSGSTVQSIPVLPVTNTGCNPCVGTTADVTPASTIRVNTNGTTGEAFLIQNCKAYFKLLQLCFDQPFGRPVSISGGLTLTFNQLNVYNVLVTVYPCGCPVASLPISVEVINGNDELSIDIVPGTNSVAVSGEIPAGIGLRFYTDPNLLRYFTSVELVGRIDVSTKAAELAAITVRDNNTKVEYIPSRPTALSVLPPIPFPPPGVNPVLPAQYPDPASVFPWTEALIPWQQNQPFPSGPDVIITPPQPVPPVFPFVDGYEDAYAKFRSVPDSVIFYLGYDAATVSPTQADWTLFLRNFVDRGYARSAAFQEPWQVANFAKRQYMNAFSVDKMQFYVDKIAAFVNTAYTDVVSNRKPFTSSFQANVVLFFLSLHIGVHQYPDYVLRYFGDFIDFVGIGDSTNARRNALLLYGNVTAPKVFEYFKARATEAISKQDQTTIAYWWNLAGLSQEALLFESVHNIVAFSQFTNVLYSIIYASLNPTNPINPALPAYPNFLELYNIAGSSDDQLNVVREAFRLTVPNSNSFSRVNPDTSEVSIQARHLHQPIMITNNPGINQTQQAFSYFTYNPNQYNPEFTTNLDGLVGLPVSNDFVERHPTSPLDEETVVDAARPLIPIFAKPTYAPFGLGYRRCAGEILVYLVTGKLLERFGQAQFEQRPGPYPTVYVAPFKGVPDNIFAVQP